MLKMSRNKGFTLIELMMVIAVVGTLATIAISNYITYRRRGYKAAANEDARNAHIAAQAYLHEWPDKIHFFGWHTVLLRLRTDPGYELGGQRNTEHTNHYCLPQRGRQDLYRGL